MRRYVRRWYRFQRDDSGIFAPTGTPLATCCERIRAQIAVTHGFRVIDLNIAFSPNFVARMSTLLPRMSSLPLVIDTVPQNEHHKMDALIEDFLDQLQCPRNPTTTHQLALVLYGVFLIWPEGLREPTTFRKFLDIVNSGRYGERKALEGALKHARLTGDYNAIRRIRTLRPSNVPLEVEFSTIASRNAVRRSGPPRDWQEPYQDGTARYLISVINDLKDPRFVHVIQSSGTGKSRMMDEAAKMIFTIPICLRSGKKSGYPQADKSIRDFFRIRKGQTIRDVKCRYVMFFQILFSVIEAEVRPMLTELTDHATLAQAWRKYLQTEDRRNTIYSNIVSSAEQKFSNRDHATDVQGPCHLAGENTITDVVPTRHPGQAKLVLYFDEAQFLLEQNAKHENHSSIANAHQILLDVLKDLKGVSVVLLSTASDLVTHKPGYACPTPAPLQRLFVELPFDLGGSGQWPIVKEQRHRLVDICEDMFMLRFGRPLWLAHWPNRSHVPPEERAKFMDFVIDKLENENCNCTCDIKRLASIGVRIPISFSKSHSAISLEEHLVARHMRLIYGIPAHREFPSTGYTSEPILAEAAARIFAASEPLESVTSFLARYIEDGTLRKGDRGELAAQLILTLAHDSALEKLVCRGELPVTSWESRKHLSRDELQKLKLNYSLQYSQPVSVCAFLTSLLSPICADAVLKCNADNALGSGTTVPLADAFKHAHVHFTHFGSAEDTSILNDEGAWLAMSRGMAWQCTSPKEPVDIVIPIFLGKKKYGSLDRYKMSALFIQSTTNVWDKMHRSHVDTETFSFFTQESGKPDDHRPYISLVMNLGVSGSNCHRDEPFIRYRLSPTASDKPNHPRYSITINGRESSVYAVAQDDLPRLLRSQPDEEHCEPKWSASSEVLQKIKPVWRGGGRCFHWSRAAQLSQNSEKCIPLDNHSNLLHGINCQCDGIVIGGVQMYSNQHVKSLECRVRGSRSFSSIAIPESSKPPWRT